jgi:glucose-1-phosphate thymidylyltransferase
VTHIRKAVILAAGLGTRMRAAAGQADLAPKQAQMADAGLKAMVPFERPFLDYLLHNLAESGIARACIVIGPSHGAVRDYYKGVPTRRLTIEFAVQPAPRGTADAVLAAGAFIGEDPVLVVNGDNLYPVASCRALVEHGAPAVAAFSRAGLLADGLIPPERIQKFAIVLAREGWLERVIEKPDAATLDAFGNDVYVSMNSWVVPPALRSVVARLPLSPRGELELPLAMQALVDSGVAVRVFPSTEPVLDLSNRGDIGALEERLRGREVVL